MRVHDVYARARKAEQANYRNCRTVASDRLGQVTGQLLHERKNGTIRGVLGTKAEHLSGRRAFRRSEGFPQVGGLSAGRRAFRRSEGFPQVGGLSAGRRAFRRSEGSRG